MFRGTPRQQKGFDMKTNAYCTQAHVQIRTQTHIHAAAGLIAMLLLLPLPAAHAQLGGLLNGAGSNGSGGGVGNLGGMLSGQSMSSGSAGNVAGILQFCIKNNYLGGSSASSAASVKDGLMGKLNGGTPSSDKGYADGAKGILNSSSGQKLDLSGGGMKEQVTKQVCDKILAQGKSML